MIKPEFLTIDPENEELLAESVDIYGQSAAVRLLVEALIRRETKRIWFKGPPGSAKTAVLEQLARAIQRNAIVNKIPLILYWTSYDDHLKNTTRDLWDTPYFNNTFVEEILHPHTGKVIYSEPGVESRELQLIEAPAEGKTSPKDRAVSAFRSIAQMDESTFFVDRLWHPIAGRRALQTRTIVEETPVSRVAEKLKEESRVILISSETNDPVSLGRKAKAKVVWMATSQEIREIRHEKSRLVNTWVEQNPLLAQTLAAGLELSESYRPNIMHNILMSEFDEDEDNEYVRQSLKTAIGGRARDAVYEAVYQRKAYLELDIPENRFVIIAPPYHPGNIHWILD